MATKKRKGKKKDELEQQKGGALPKREVMSIIATNPGVISIPGDPTVVETTPGWPEPVERPVSDA